MRWASAEAGGKAIGKAGTETIRAGFFIFLDGRPGMQPTKEKKQKRGAAVRESEKMCGGS